MTRKKKKKIPTESEISRAGVRFPRDLVEALFIFFSNKHVTNTRLRVPTPQFIQRNVPRECVLVVYMFIRY